MPLAPHSGTLTKKQVAHLLRRATFGATKQQIDLYVNRTPTYVVDQLFRATLPAVPPPIDPLTGQTWVNVASTAANSKDGELETYFLGWFIGQMLNPSLAYCAREKLVFFLHTHFTTIKSKVASSRALYFQNELFRQYALDDMGGPDINFKELTKKASVDNAMILLLDGYLNVKGSPNENYARELLELYTIGRGREGSLPTGLPAGDYGVYTEQDVQIGARILSGWDFDDTYTTLDPDTGLPRGKVKGSPTNASAHDADENKPKTLSNHFGSFTVTQDPLLAPGGVATEESALDEISQLVDQIYAQEETAKNICRKIYRFFVYHEITDAIDSTIIQTMANDFRVNFKIQPIIENLLKSQHFYDSADTAFVNDNFGGIIKSPLDLAIGTFRFFEVPIADMTTSTAEFYEQTGSILESLNEMGMRFFEPIDVSGYDAYSQFPIYNRSWITPNYLALRYKFIDSLIDERSTSSLNVNTLTWVQANISNATARISTELVKELVSYFFPVPDNLTYDDAADDVDSGLTAKRLSYFKVRMLPANTGYTDSYWTTNIWDTNSEVRAALNKLFNSLLQSPEYQLL